MRAKVLGVTSYDKNGKTNFVLHCMSNFNDYDIQNGAVGYKASTVWTNTVNCSAIVPGDLIELYFEPGFNNTASLAGFNILNNKKDAGFDSVSAPVPDSPKSGK